MFARYTQDGIKKKPAPQPTFQEQLNDHKLRLVQKHVERRDKLAELAQRKFAIPAADMDAAIRQ